MPLKDQQWTRAIFFLIFFIKAYVVVTCLNCLDTAIKAYAIGILIFKWPQQMGTNVKHTLL